MITVRDNPDRHRYEVFEADRRAGFSTYRLTDTTIAFMHTEIDPVFSGHGLAKKLVAEALADARQRGLGVLPFCPYVRTVIAGDLEQYLDLVPVEDRERFELPSGSRS